MLTELLVCPECGQRLELGGKGLTCLGCGACIPVRQGVPSFTDPALYWGEIGYEEMCRTNDVATEKGWQVALEEVVRPLLRDRSIEYFADENRADWRLVMPSMTSWRILDLGAGWGPLTFALARHCRQVIALESIWERARFIEIRRQQARVANVEVVHADACRLPFAGESFDLAVVNGLLEWVALWNTTGDPRDQQRDFLARIGRVLRPGGWLYVGIENRIGESSFRGATDHSGLPYTMLMPRAVADWCVRHWQPGYRTESRKGYRTYTYSYWGYSRLLREAGFRPIEAYWVTPGYNLPRNMIPLDHKQAAVFHLRPPGYRQSVPGFLLRVAKRALARIGAARVFAENFCWIARKD